jgi:hypothetical protein
MQHRIGIDIGGVIIQEIKTEGGLAHIDENFLEVPPVEGAFQGVAELVRTFDPENVFLISKARAEVQGNCRQWLAHHRFFDETGVSEENLHFCLERSGKRDLCQKLFITDFIDDKLEVLSHLTSLVPRLYLFNPCEEEMVGFEHCLSSVTVCQQWPRLLNLIRNDRV